MEHTLATVLANLASLVAIGISNSLGPIISQALDTQIFRFIITGASIAPSLEYACAVILLITRLVNPQVKEGSAKSVVVMSISFFAPWTPFFFFSRLK